MSRCEWCGWAGQTDGAHIFSRGAGGPDIPINIVYLCRLCHSKSHNANSGNKVRPNRDDMLQIAAMREGTTPEAITAEVHRLRALGKDGKPINRKGGG